MSKEMAGTAETAATEDVEDRTEDSAKEVHPFMFFGERVVPEGVKDFTPQQAPAMASNVPDERPKERGATGAETEENDDDPETPIDPMDETLSDDDDSKKKSKK